VIIAALYLIYHLALGSYGTLFHGYEEGYWWQYVIAIAILSLGIAFLYAGKVYTVAFNKQTGLLSVYKRSIFCKMNEKNYRLSDIHNIKAYKKGHGGINVYTVHYVIQAEVNQAPILKILETQNREKVVKQLYVIRNFLGMPCSEDHLTIIDHSTTV
jgi:hypothetical protein